MMSFVNTRGGRRECGALKFRVLAADKQMGRFMSAPATSFGKIVWDLPPLILHPFNEHVPPSAMIENSRAALMLSGLVSNDQSDPEVLLRRLLAGRYAEIRMLFFLGKDLLRWIGQCGECVGRIRELEASDIRAQSFAGLLITSPPEAVKEKLANWGVADYGSIFSRALGLNTLFTSPPEADLLAEEFLRNYHRYADSLYRCYMELQPHRAITAVNFQFDLYASGEYSRLLESEWGEPDSGETEGGEPEG